MLRYRLVPRPPLWHSPLPTARARPQPPPADTLFQETYHRPTFKHMHIAGPKSGARCREHGGPAPPPATAAAIVAVDAPLPSPIAPPPAPLRCRHCADYNNRILTHDRAMRAGLDDVGLGTLFGLYDYKYEVRRAVLRCHAERGRRERGGSTARQRNSTHRRAQCVGHGGRRMPSVSPSPAFNHPATHPPTALRCWAC